ADAVLAKGRAAFDAGDYRWVAELVNHLVFADPDNMEARNLQADALEQLGYQAESGPWRDFYLTGAQELRLVRPKATTPRQGATGQLRTLPADQLLDSLSVRLNGDTVGRAQPAMLLTFTDADETFSLKVRNGVLHHRPAKPSETAIRLSRNTLVDLVVGDRTLEAAATDGLIEGDAAPLSELLEQLDRFDFWFEIVLP
ncbi:MAG TPA: alkyl sulfatase dimerization domain-containing protein, partial [Phenylobacterium sp.]|nr:alkyl sulfatase dimerization domain-containing protein [Phenylobacterium sp.]